MIWSLRKRAELSFSDTNEKLDKIPSLVRRFLIARGIHTEEALSELTKPQIDQLQSPFSILGMEKACERIKQAYLKQETVCLYGDFDLDGTSGLAMAVKAFYDLGFKKVIPMQARRLRDGYGFHAHLVQKAAEEGATLFITIDVGITAFAGCEKAQELGADVIITDHHLPSDELPKALVVLNPNQKECTSDLKYLCGAGVAFYLLRAIKRTFVDAGMIEESVLDLKKCLDCFAIATITDMVPLQGDNRILTKIGLKVLSETQRPGLKALLMELGMYGRALSSNDVGIRFAPKLNALSRLDGEILPIDIYLQSDMTEAMKLASQVLSANQSRISLQGSAESELFQNLEKWPYKNFVFQYSPNFHKGVLGLLATKVSGEKNLPSFIGYESEEGMIVGSARLPESDPRHLVEALKHCEDVLVRFGGHRQAAGFELEKKNAEVFINKLNDFFNQPFEGAATEIEYDCHAEISEFQPPVLQWFEILGPFGQGFPQPLFSLGPVKVMKITQLRGGHLKLILSDLEMKNQCQVMWFSPSAKVQLKPGDLCCCLVELQWNYFDGMKTVQVLIREFIHEGDPKWENTSSYLAQDLTPQSISSPLI